MNQIMYSEKNYTENKAPKSSKKIIIALVILILIICGAIFAINKRNRG